MRVEAIAFTREGCALACRIAAALRQEGVIVGVSAPERFATCTDVRPHGSLAAWTERAFAQADALLFVSACGIAVRAIAPRVRDKLRDPAVVCVDEGAGFVVPLLSGHVGGANALARQVAKACGAVPVISTATDVRGVFAVDVWAQAQGLALLDRTEAKQFSACLLDGGDVGFASDFAVAGSLPAGVVAHTACPVGLSISLDVGRRPFACTVRLVPRVVTVGVGCRRGVPAERFAQVVDAALAEAVLPREAVAALATIDVKAEEPGLIAFAQERGWDLRFHAAEELAAVPGSFSSSAFVRQTVGVDNVCERAACACGERLVLSRRAAQGVTVALALRDPQLSFDDGTEGGCS